MENIELKRFWEQVKEELLGVLPENAHPWLYPLEVSGYDKGVLTVVTGQMMGRDLLRKNHYNQMVEALKRVSGDENSRLVIIYDETAAKTLKRETEKLQKKASEVSIKEQAMENLANINLKTLYRVKTVNLHIKQLWRWHRILLANIIRYLYTVIPALEKHILCRQ